MGNIDLKDAYLTAHIAEQSRKFLRFEFESELFEFTCLNFGLSTASFILTKIMEPVFLELGEQKVISVIYSDHIRCFGKCIFVSEKY